MAGITLTVQGDKEFVAKLGKFGVSVLDLSDSMDETGRYLTRFFSGEVLPHGDKSSASRGHRSTTTTPHLKRVPSRVGHPHPVWTHEPILQTQIHQADCQPLE
jgi:hypothetical protein